MVRDQPPELAARAPEDPPPGEPAVDRWWSGHDLELSGPAVATADYTATELPYEGGELSMLIIVPEADS
jgi:hypothetical protein